MKLNFRQTEILWAIVMAGSSSGAARLLNVSQPAVSKMLSQIEAQFGTKLFERVRGKLQPTDRVRMLFEEIAKAQKAMRRVNDIADSLTRQGGGALALASIPSLAQAVLPLSLIHISDAAAHFLKVMGDVGQIQPWHTDVRDPAAIAKAVAGVDDVVNLVGILFEKGRQRFADLHAEAPGHIAAAARAAKVARLVHLSAIGASADSPALYAQSKAAGETAVRAAFPAAVILRPSLVIGAEDRFFNRFGRMAIWAPALPLIAAAARFQPVAVSDVADAILAALLRPEAQGLTYELGGPKIYSFRQLLELTLSAVGRRRYLIAIPPPLALLLATALERLPTPPLTRDQIRLLQQDNVVAADARGLSELGIDPSPIEPLLPGYMNRLRPGGGRG